MANFGWYICAALCCSLFFSSHSFLQKKGSTGILLTSRQPRASITILMATKVPTNVKETISEMRKSIQAALQAKNSRMAVELPRGADFGMEKADDVKSATQYDGGVEKSDRELARLLVEMFQPLGESLVCTFPSDQQVKKAKSSWGDQYEGTIKTLTPKKTKGGKRRGKGGFAAAVKEAEGADAVGPLNGVLPPGTEVVLAVAPSQKDVQVLEKLANEVGMGCLIMIVNGRFWERKDVFQDDEQKQFFDQVFEPVFDIKLIAEPDGDGLLQVKAFGEDWVIAKKQTFGPPRVLAASAGPPGEAEVAAALEASAKLAAEGPLGGLVDGLSGQRWPSAACILCHPGQATKLLAP